MKRCLMSALSAGVLVALLAMAPVSASAAPEFWSEAGPGRELLRSVSSVPSKDQPASIEFNNSGEVSFLVHTIGKTKEFKEEFVVLCNEFEYGTTVVTNNPEGIGGENKLALPWGVAETDSCQEGAGGPPVPVYFDTTAAGVVPATITFSGVFPAIKATLHKLKLSMQVGKVFCTSTFENTSGEVVDVREGFVEETTPNTNIQFIRAPFTGTCEGKPLIKFSGLLTANLFVETMSTTTDTVWIE